MSRKVSRNNILLLIATITPQSGVPNLKRMDPNLRLQDYLQALSFYISKIRQSYSRIVFAENSNSNVSKLKELAEQTNIADKVEFIVFNGLNYPADYDQGYGEFKLVDYAMLNSRLINAQAKNSIVWKITGHYVIRNIKQIIMGQPSHFDICCNYRNYPKLWVDTFLIAWTPKVYQECLKRVYERLKTNVPGVPKGTSAEKLMRVVLEEKNNIKSIRRFRVTPLIERVRGADNRGYSTDHLWKFRLGDMFKTLFPWMWI